MRSVSPIQNAAAILLLSLWITQCSFAGGAEQQVCNVGADYFPRQPTQLGDDSSPRLRGARARVAGSHQPGRLIPSRRKDSWIWIGRRKGS